MVSVSYPDLTKFMAEGAGANAKVLPRFGCQMVRSGALNFIGMNRQVSERRNSKLSDL